jgi:hypothetical protein
MGMDARSRLGVCILGLAAIAAANPYETISQRNIFHLSPPKPEVSKPGEVFKPPPDIKLNGIAAFGSHKWVLLSRAEPGKVPRHLLMREGEKDGGLEIVDVDEIAAIVKLRSAGALMELKLATNSIPKIDLATQRFVNDHTRAHELHQRREAQRIARERAEAERLQPAQSARETQSPNFSPAEEAILESQR